MNNFPSDAWNLLSPQLTEHRRERMQRTASLRTGWVRLVVQDVHQPHNVSACIRSAEAFGIQDIHVISNKHKFSASTVARGVDAWVDIHQHDEIDDCIAKLHEDGFLVAAAFPHGKAVSLGDLPLEKPVALVFGNEHEGLDPVWREKADLCFTIPMAGIVESLNISVSAAISMYETTQRAKSILSRDAFYLSKNRQEKLLNQWICRQITTWDVQLPALRSRSIS